MKLFAMGVITASGAAAAAPPSGLSIVDTDIQNTETGSQSISLSVQSGDLVVVGAVGTDAALGAGLITGGGLTWTQRTTISSNSGTSNGGWHSGLWTAIADTTGTLVVNSTIPTFGTIGGYAIRGQHASFVDQVGSSRHLGTSTGTLQVDLPNTTVSNTVTVGFVFPWDTFGNTVISPFVKDLEINYAVMLSVIAAATGNYDPGVTISPASQFVGSAISVKGA